MKNVYGVTFAALAMSSISLGTQAHELEECKMVEYEVPLYAGYASCQAYDSASGWRTLSDYFSPQLSSWVRLSDFYYDYNQNTYVNLSCTDTLPYAGTTTLEREECTPVEHDHEPPARTTVAIADVQDDEMDVYDSNCSWGGWQSYTMVRQNTLSCNGQPVADVALLVGSPYNGEECNTNITADGYSRKYPGSNTCYITIYRDD